MDFLNFFLVYVKLVADGVEGQVFDTFLLGITAEPSIICSLLLHLTFIG